MGHPVGEQAVAAHVLKLDHHIHLSVRLGNVFQCLFGGDERSLRQSHAVVVRQNIPAEFRQIVMDMRTVIVFQDPLAGGHEMVVRKTFLLGDEGDDVLPESVHAQIQPEFQDLLYFLTDQRVVHVQVRLLDGEQMEIVFPTGLVPGPGLSLKVGVPVVGERAVRFCRSPDVVIRIGIDALPALPEPLMLITGVIDHEIHDDLHVPCVGTVQNFLEGVHATIFPGDVHVIGDVITHVGVGGRVQGRKPDAVASQGFDIIQFFQHSVKIPDTVPVSVFKTAGPDLIEHFIFIPSCTFHGSKPPERIGSGREESSLYSD